MTVLMLCMRMGAVFTVFGTGAVAEDAIITGNLVRQSGFGQAIERTVQGDPVHIDEGILNILMRYRTARGNQGCQHIDAGLRDAYRRIAQLQLCQRMHFARIVRVVVG